MAGSTSADIRIGMLGAGAAAIPSPHYNLTIVSNARTEDVLSNFELMKALAGA